MVRKPLEITGVSVCCCFHYGGQSEGSTNWETPWWSYSQPCQPYGGLMVVRSRPLDIEEKTNKWTERT